MPDFNIAGIGMTSQRTRGRLVKRLEANGIASPQVLDAIATTPRHLFVDEALAHRAYEDAALPIGHNQTISQPYIVALMTQALLEVGPERVLEIGTGSGYQTAVLAGLVDKVFTVERIHALSERARDRFVSLGLKNVRQKYDDGNLGWTEEGPFDGILVTAGARAVPEALLRQLAEGGRLVIPVGDGSVQALTVIDRIAGQLQQRPIEKVRFVPLLRGTAR